MLEYARLNFGTIAVLDDKAAGRAAHALQIPLTGTLGLLVAAVKMGFIPSVSAAIDSVRVCGIYVDAATVSRLVIGDQ